MIDGVELFAIHTAQEAEGDDWENLWETQREEAEGLSANQFAVYTMLEGFSATLNTIEERILQIVEHLELE
jgi:hypothetical protein